MVWPDAVWRTDRRRMRMESRRPAGRLLQLRSVPRR